MILTLHYRLKGNNRMLPEMANSVNYIWNYCNAANYKRVKYYSKWLSEFDLHKLTAGCSKDLNLNSTTIQSVCKEFKTRQFQFKKLKLKWRTSRKNKSLGWIPFKSSAISFKNNKFIYNKYQFKFWDSKYKDINLNELDIKTGSFNQDSKGNWFINLQVEVAEKEPVTDIKTAIGIDLGLKDIITTSNSDSYKNNKYYYSLQSKLAVAQRAKKKKQIKNIYAKIKNQRKDYLHKLTTNIVRDNDLIVVGDLHLGASKHTNDAGFGMIKSFLKYKTIRFGKIFKLVNEAWTTQRCSVCKELTGPKGLNGLSVRDWECSSCGAKHQRDVNAATNILNLGLGH
jgi:IS605 OrfB family transposase